MLQKKLHAIQLIIYVLAIAALIYSAVDMAVTSVDDGDFRAFYYAASVIIDNQVLNNQIYDYETMAQIYPRYGMERMPLYFIYSMVAAYLISPIGLLPFETAKIIWNLLNLAAYLFAIVILLRLSGAAGFRFHFLFLLSILWMPFLDNLIFIQVNGFILLFVVIGVYLASQNHPLIGGVMLSTAVLFKLWPLAIVLVLGLKNHRILVSFAITFVLAMLIPGAIEWFTAIHKGLIRHYSYTYQLLFQLGTIYPITYFLAVSGITAAAAYYFKTKGGGYGLLISLAVTAMFLVMPVVEYHHLTMLIIPYIYLLAAPYRNNPLKYAASSLSLILTSFPFFNGMTFLSTVGLIILWFVILYTLVEKDNLLEARQIT